MCVVQWAMKNSVQNVNLGTVHTKMVFCRLNSIAALSWGTHERYLKQCYSDKKSSESQGLN